jgi:hypothetical protein
MRRGAKPSKKEGGCKHKDEIKRCSKHAAHRMLSHDIFISGQNSHEKSGSLLQYAGQRRHWVKTYLVESCVENSVFGRSQAHINYSVEEVGTSRSSLEALGNDVVVASQVAVAITARIELAARKVDSMNAAHSMKHNSRRWSALAT